MCRVLNIDISLADIFKHIAKEMKNKTAEHMIKNIGVIPVPIHEPITYRRSPRVGSCF